MPERKRGHLLATLLFTDIVGSTELADGLGDRRWRELLARAHAQFKRAQVADEIPVTDGKDA